MLSFGEKAKIKKAGNLNYGRSYVITIVIDTYYRVTNSKFNAIYHCVASMWHPNAKCSTWNSNRGHGMNQVHSTMYLWQLELRSSSGWAEPKVRWPLLRVYVHDMYRLLSSATTHQATSKLFFKSTDICIVNVGLAYVHTLPT